MPKRATVACSLLPLDTSLHYSMIRWLHDYIFTKLQIEKITLLFKNVTGGLMDGPTDKPNDGLTDQRIEKLRASD